MDNELKSFKNEEIKATVNQAPDSTSNLVQEKQKFILELDSKYI